MRKAGQRCANGYLNQMGVPVLGVGPLVLFWGAREGAFVGSGLGKEVQVGWAQKEEILVDPGARGLFFLFFFPQRLVLFFPVAFWNFGDTGWFLTHLLFGGG